MVWVWERQWAVDQIIEASITCVILDFTSTQYEKVLEWVLARGSCVVPLEPSELVADWREEVRVMVKNTENDMARDAVLPKRGEQSLFTTYRLGNRPLSRERCAS
jgi:hypothetical protein